MSLPKLPTLKRKTVRVSWKPVVAVALIFAILFVAFYPSRENPLNIVILHERVEALEEKVSVLSELDASLTSLEQQLEAVDALIENLLTQQTIINTQVSSINTQVSSINTWINGWESYWNSWLAGFGDWQAQINAWINGWEATWNSWLGSFGDWQAQINAWISGWESYWNSWLAGFGDWQAQVNNWISEWEDVWNSWLASFNNWREQVNTWISEIEEWVNSVEVYVQGVSEAMRKAYGAIIPFHYFSLEEAISAGEQKVILVNMQADLDTSVTLEVNLINSTLYLSGSHSDSNLEIRGIRNGVVVLNTSTNISTLRIYNCFINGSATIEAKNEIYILKCNIACSSSVTFKIVEPLACITLRENIFTKYNPTPHNVYIYLCAYGFIFIEENLVNRTNLNLIFFDYGQVTIKENTFENYGSLSVTLYNYGEVTIQENNFDMSNTGILCYFGGYYKILINDNLFEKSKLEIDTGIGTGRVGGITINDNVFFTPPISGEHSLSLGNLCFSVVTGNFFYLLTAPNTIGIRLYDCDRLTITGNTFNAYQRTAITGSIQYSIIATNNLGGGSISISGTGNIIEHNL